jgi:hypothetical protein
MKIQNTLSNSHYIENGLPQGSALSVSPFLVAINDIGNNILSPVKDKLFATYIAVGQTLLPLHNSYKSL